MIQSALAAEIGFGVGFLIPDITPDRVLFLSSGALDFQRALPVSGPLLLMVDLVVWSLSALPGVVIGLLVACLRYDLSYSFNWTLIVLASLLVTTMATAVGCSIVVLLPAMLAQLISQVLVFVVLLFSLITFPASQLPEWFQAMHRYLPIQPAAELLRAGVASEDFAARGRDLVVMSLWTVAGLLITTRALVSRGRAVAPAPRTTSPRPRARARNGRRRRPGSRPGPRARGA